MNPIGHCKMIVYRQKTNGKLKFWKEIGEISSKYIEKLEASLYSEVDVNGLDQANFLVMTGWIPGCWVFLEKCWWQVDQMPTQVFGLCIAFLHCCTAHFISSIFHCAKFCLPTC